MKKILIGVLLLICSNQVSGYWGISGLKSDDERGECFEERYTVSKNELRKSNIYEYKLDYEDRNHFVLQGNQLVAATLVNNSYFQGVNISFGKIGDCFIEECNLPQGVPENYGEYDLGSQKSGLEFEVDKNFQLDICFPPIGGIGCVGELPKGQVSYDFDIESESLKPIYYLYDTDENIIKVEDQGEFENYDIKKLQLKFEPINDISFVKQKVKVNRLYAEFKEYTFLMKPENIDQDIEIYYKKPNINTTEVVENDMNMSDLQNCPYINYHGYTSLNSPEYKDIIDKKSKNKFQEINIYSTSKNQKFYIVTLFGIVIFIFILIFIFKRKK